jgi:hypothetical protein
MLKENLLLKEKEKLARDKEEMGLVILKKI